MNWIKQQVISLKDWIKQHKFISFISSLVILVFIFGICLFFNFEGTMKYVGINLNERQDIKWENIKNTGYALGVLLLIIQISISNRRADAAEKTAKATLSANIEQRYDNAVNHLKAEEPFIRIGAIYSLYHISQSSDSHDNAIFDMFCSYLKRNKNKLSTKEKQIIIDKLFRVNQESRVLKDIKEIDLTNANLTGANLTEANLTEADLTGANLTGANLTEANLTEADLTGADLTGADLTGANLTDVQVPYAWNQWMMIKYLKGAKLDNITFGSGVTFKNKDLTKVSFKKANLSYIDLTGANLTGADLTGANLTGADLTGANLTGADLTGVIGLTFEQLGQVKCLYDIEGINQELDKQLKQEKPELFKKLKEDSDGH